jgi:hypothetical protein
MVKSTTFSIEMGGATELRALNNKDLKRTLMSAELGVEFNELDYENIGVRSVLQQKIKLGIKVANAIKESVVTLDNINDAESMSMVVDCTIRRNQLMKKFNEDFDVSVTDEILLLNYLLEELRKVRAVFRGELTETEMNS